MIGQKLKEYRQTLHVTGETLANLAGIKRSYLSQIENEKKVPPVDTFLNLVNAIAKISPLNYRNENYILTEENCNKFIQHATIKVYEVNDYPDKVSVWVRFKDMFSGLDFIFNKNFIEKSYEPMEPFVSGKEIDSKPFISDVQDELKYFFFNVLNDRKSIYDNIENLSDPTLFDDGDEICLYEFPFVRQSLFEWWYNNILKEIIMSGVKDSVIYIDKEISEIDMPLSDYPTNLSDADRKLLADLWPLMDENGNFTPYNDDDNINVSKDLLDGKTVTFDVRSITDKNVRALLDGQLLSNDELTAIKFILNGIRYNRQQNKK